MLGNTASSRRVLKAAAVLLSAALLITAPGLGAWQAFANTIGGAAKARTGPQAVPTTAVSPLQGVSRQLPMAGMLGPTSALPNAALPTAGAPEISLPADVAAAGPGIAAREVPAIAASRPEPGPVKPPAALGSPAAQAAREEVGTAPAGRAAARRVRAVRENAAVRAVRSGRDIVGGLVRLFHGGGRGSAAGEVRAAGTQAAGRTLRGARLSRPADAEASGAGLLAARSGAPDGDRSAASPPAPPADPAALLSPDDPRVRRILFGYKMQQLFLTASFAFYTALFTPVAKVVAGPLGLLWGRLGYAGSLAIVSPFAGVAVERMSVRAILKYSFLARAAIWTLLVPSAWLALSGAPFVAAFVGLMFLDGAIVSANTLVDIDGGGLSLLAKQYGFQYDDRMQKNLNALKDGAASFGRMVLAPAMALMGLMFAAGVASASGGLVLAMALSFGVPALLGTFFLTRYLPKEILGKAELKRVTLADVFGGLKLVAGNRRIRNRLGMNAVEKAIEDAMAFVLFMEFGMMVLAPALGTALAGAAVPSLLAPLAGLVLKVLSMGPMGQASVGALAGALLLSAGKLGALIASYLMSRWWEPPAADGPVYRPYRVFFRLAFIASFATLLFPAALMLVSGGSFWAGAGLAALAAFLFNVFFTGPVQGFRQMMQRILKDEGASGRLFGINNTIVMGVNFAVVGGMTAFIAAFGIQAALWATAIAIVGYGVLQLFGAPRWLFSPEELAGHAPKEAKLLEGLREALAEAGRPVYRTERRPAPSSRALIVADVSSAAPSSFNRAVFEAAAGDVLHHLVLDSSWLEPVDGDAAAFGYALRKGVVFDETGQAVVVEYERPVRVDMLKRHGRDPPATLERTGQAWRFRNNHHNRRLRRPAPIDDGRQKAVLVLGGNHFGRPHLLTEPMKAAEKLGVKMLLVDDPANQPKAEDFPPEDFIPAPIFSHKKGVYEASADAVERYLADHPEIHAVGAIPYFHAFVEHSGAIVDRLRQVHDPGFAGNEYLAVQTAQEKDLTRNILAAFAPEVSVPFRRVDPLLSVEQGSQSAAALFEQLTEGVPGRKVVMKGVTGAAKAGIRKDLDSPEAVAAAYREVHAELTKFTQDKELGPALGLDVLPAIMLELQAEGPEVDVEIIRDKDGGVAVVIGNPAPINGRVEKGMTLPARLHPHPEKAREMERLLVEGAIAALDAAGLEVGNFHVEMILHEGKRPMVIEINPRMAGANGFFLMQEKFGGYNLIEQAMAAVIGRPVESFPAPSHPVLLSRKLLPETAGRIQKIAGVEEAEKMPGAVDVKMVKSDGGEIVTWKEGFGDAIYGYVLAGGGTYEEAKARMMAILEKIEITVETRGNELKTQTGAFGHSFEDENIPPEYWD